MDKQKLILVTLVVLISMGGFIYSQQLRFENIRLKARVNQLESDPQTVAKEEIKNITQRMSKIVVLPTGEEPTLATVTDKEKLKDQPMFAKAENGDKILIYTISKKAYIYRPASNIIIDIVPVNVAGAQVSITGVDANNPLKVSLVNGTMVPNQTTTLEKRIVDSNIGGIKVVSKANAKSTDYKKTLVIDIAGKYKAQAVELAKLIGGEVATETAEIKPNADLMVIIGANFK